MKTIGLTGGVGAGKTRVLDYIKEKYDAYVIVADRLARSLEEPGQCCYNELVSAFGEEILTEDGYLDAEKFSKIIFTDAKNLQIVNGIIHPAVKKQILKIIADEASKNTKLLVVEAALLIEEGYDAILDELWYVYADEAVRRKRLKESRGYLDEKIDSIMSKQLSDNEFRKHCKVIIDNSGDFEKVKSVIDEALGDI